MSEIKVFLVLWYDYFMKDPALRNLMFVQGILKTSNRIHLDSGQALVDLTKAYLTRGSNPWHIVHSRFDIMKYRTRLCAIDKQSC